MAILKIGGVDMPEPSKYSVSTSDLHADSSTRTETGHLVINRIRSGVYKLEVGWNALNAADLTTIRNATSGVTFNVTFLDIDGTTKTKTMYSGDYKSEPRRLFGNDKRWDISFNLIEV